MDILKAQIVNEIPPFREVWTFRCGESGAIAVDSYRLYRGERNIGGTLTEYWANYVDVIPISVISRAKCEFKRQTDDLISKLTAMKTKIDNAQVDGAEKE